MVFFRSTPPPSTTGSSARSRVQTGGRPTVRPTVRPGVRLVVRLTLNNLFITALKTGGEVLFWTSAGCSGFKGPRRATPLAAEQTARSFADRLASAGFLHLRVELLAPLGTRTKAVVKGLFYSGKLKIEQVRFLPRQAHNGIRPKKLRRV